MYIETSTRSLVKGISWRLFATLTTIIIVYVFFGRLDLAIMAGLLETVAKVLLYYMHERMWQKIRFGKKKIEPINLWFTGLPLSGKTTIANGVYEELQKLDIPIERIDSKDVRELIPNIGFNREDRNRHITRIAHLIATLQNNSISTISSFVSPYEESRQKVKQMTKNFILIYVKADIESCKARDYKGSYKRALEGELMNFTGISDVYEEPQDADICLDTDKMGPKEAIKIVVDEIKRRKVI